MFSPPHLQHRHVKPNNASATSQLVTPLRADPAERELPKDGLGLERLLYRVTVLDIASERIEARPARRRVRLF
jgi:hypothetical protein